MISKKLTILIGIAIITTGFGIGLSRNIAVGAFMGLYFTYASFIILDR